MANSLEIGGLEKVVLNLLNNEDQTEKIKMAVVCLEENGALDDCVKEGTPHYHLHKTKVSRLGLIFRFAQIVKKEKIDIIHCHNFAPLLFSVLVKLLLLGRVKVIYTEHNQIYSISQKHYKIFRHLLKFANRIVTVSKDLQQHFLKEKLGKKSTVIWNGIPAPQFDEAEVERISKHYRKNDSDFLIGTAVVMSKQKGLKYLVKAAKEIVAKYPQIKFVLIGDGPLREGLEQQVAELGLKDNFIFPGYQKDIPNHLKALDVFILPSLWEGFSIALIEALALGLPIITTDVGGNGELVKHNSTGLLIPSENPRAIKEAVFKMYRDKELRQKFAENGKAYYEKYCTVHTMVENYNELYLNLDQKKE